MKRAYITTQFDNTILLPATPITRARASYLLRAGRSRRRSNIVRKPHGYTIADANLVLIFA